MNKIAILASGNGTTAEAFIRAARRGEVDAEVVAIICNREHAGIFARIDKLNEEFGLHIKTYLVNSTTHPAKAGEVVMRGAQTRAEEAMILRILKESELDLIVLMGYLRRLGPKLVAEFGWQDTYFSPYQAMMLNSHPGLLPHTAGTFGIATQQLTLDKQMNFGGQTLHVVSDVYDEGPTIAEHKVKVEPGDTAETLFARVQAVEKEELPNDIEAFIEGRKTYFLGGKS